MRKRMIILLSLLQVFSLYGALRVNIERKRCKRARTFSFNANILAEHEWKKRFEEWKKDPIVTHEKPWQRDGMDEFISKLREETSPETNE